ncbi:hypothetical protein BH11ARM2_BH11ARM2_05820 [soil metagenome]
MVFVRRYAFIPALAVVLASVGCSSPPANADVVSKETGTTTTPPSTTSAPSTPEATPTPPPASGSALADGAPGATAPNAGDDVAVMDTSDGRIVVKLLSNKAPKTVENFETLAKKGFYDGTKFHRIIKGFMIQGGDPLTKDDSKKAMWGTGGPGYMIKAEFNDTPHTRGILSMARSSDPDSAGSQFYIVHQDSNFLDGQYTAFGQVVDGMKTVDEIADTEVKMGTGGDDKPSVPVTPVMLKSVKIEKWPVK